MAKINRWLAALAALVAAGAWFQPSVAGSDLWWHLAAGREILATRSLPTVDHFSFTFGGQPWMHHEWLWGVGYWLAWELHPQLVAWANLALLFAVFGVAFAVARRHCGSAFGAGVALVGAAAASYWFLDIRPHELTLLFVGLFLLTRDRPWAKWLWPPLMVLWCNLHGGFVFGFGAIGLFALVETLRASYGERRIAIDWRLWSAVALTGLAFLCNPWGWRILEYPIAYLDADSPFREILEWQPPGFSLDPRGFSGRFTWLLAAALAGTAIELRSPRRDWYLVSLAAVTCTMALTSRRFIPLFAVTALPIVAMLFTALRDVVVARLPAEPRRRLELVAPLLALIAALALWRDVRLNPLLLERWTESSLYPRAALTYLRALAPGPRLLNHYNWGGYVMLHAPEFKVLIDGRANTLYDDKTYLDYVGLTNLAEGLAGRLAQYPVDAALLPAGSGRLAEVLASPRYGWRVAYSDGIATVLLPPRSPRLGSPLPNAGQVLGDDPDWLLFLGEAAAREGRLEAARSLTERAIERDPLMVRGYGQLAELSAQAGDAAGIAAAIERGIDFEPRSTQSYRQVEAYAWSRMGDRDRTLAALEASVPRGPFSRPESVLARIATLRGETQSR
jgi:tetratricopeptide (TPR) repeat protein